MGDTKAAGGYTITVKTLAPKIQTSESELLLDSDASTGTVTRLAAPASVSIELPAESDADPKIDAKWAALPSGSNEKGYELAFWKWTPTGDVSLDTVLDGAGAVSSGSDLRKDVTATLRGFGETGDYFLKARASGDAENKSTLTSDWNTGSNRTIQFVAQPTDLTLNFGGDKMCIRDRGRPDRQARRRPAV